MGKILTKQEFYKLGGYGINKPSDLQKCITWKEVYDSKCFNGSTNSDNRLADSTEVSRTKLTCSTSGSIDIASNYWTFFGVSGNIAQLKISWLIDNTQVFTKSFSFGQYDSTLVSSVGSMNFTGSKPVTVRIEFIDGGMKWSKLTAGTQYDLEFKIRTWDDTCWDVDESPSYTYSTTVKHQPRFSNNYYVSDPKTTSYSYTYTPVSCEIGPYLEIKCSNIKEITGSTCSAKMVGEWEE